MSVRHLERWPSADWGEIWFPVHIGSHPPGSVRKWVRAQISATALVGSTWCKTAQNVPGHRPPLSVL